MENNRKSVTFRKRGSGTITVLGNQDDQSYLINGLSNGGIGSSRRQKYFDTQWYTRPLHLGRKSPPSASTRHAVPPQRPVSPATVDRSESTADSLLSDDKPRHVVVPDSDRNENNGKTGEGLDNTLTPMDAREHFPVTLGAGYENLRPFNSDQSNGSDPLTPPPKDLPTPDPTPWKLPCSSVKSSSRGKARPGSGHSSSSSRSRSRKSRPDSAHSSSSSTSKGSLDRMYLMAAEAPVTAAGCSTVLLSSPYTSELARLRMDRLRIEEEHLLEVKRQEELERIRGPQPKWYELKTSRFHYEAHKNNDLLENKPNWQALMDYRNELERASKNFHKTYTSAATSS